MKVHPFNCFTSRIFPVRSNYSVAASCKFLLPPLSTRADSCQEPGTSLSLSLLQSSNLFVKHISCIMYDHDHDPRSLSLGSHLVDHQLQTISTPSPYSHRTSGGATVLQMMAPAFQCWRRRGVDLDPGRVRLHGRDQQHRNPFRRSKPTNSTSSPMGTTRNRQVRFTTGHILAHRR